MKKIISGLLVVFCCCTLLQAQTVYQNSVPNGETWYKIKTRGTSLCKISTSGSYALHQQIVYLISGYWNTAEVTVVSEFNYNHQYVDLKWGYVGSGTDRYLAIKSTPRTSGISVNGFSIYDVSDPSLIIELEELTGTVTEIAERKTLFVNEKDSKVGVGTLVPSSKLAVEGGDLHIGNETSSNGQRRYARIYGYDANAQFYGTIHSNWEDSKRTFDIYTNNQTQQLKIDASANSSARIGILPGENAGVGIGTFETGSHKLAVEGSIGAREIKVEASGWSDFVFENDYDLRTLEEVEEHINEKGHLPEIPSEVEVTENGINLGEMNAKLLQKIEELTLYMIEQNKQNQAQQKELEAQSALIEQLKNEVSALKSE